MCEDTADSTQEQHCFCVFFKLFWEKKGFIHLCILQNTTQLQLYINLTNRHHTEKKKSNSILKSSLCDRKQPGGPEQREKKYLFFYMELAALPSRQCDGTALAPLHKMKVNNNRRPINEF